jgi:hypothetical protein
MISKPPTNIIELLNSQGALPVPKQDKSQEPFIERAMIVITFKGNPNQLGIPFDKLKDAMKAFDNLREDSLTPEAIVKGPISTAVIRVDEISSFVLVDTLAGRRMRGEQV